MMPVYRYMDSDPHQRTPQYWIPGFEAVLPHHKVDPSRSSLMYESWPCNSNYGYSVPFQGCCNYGNFPGFYGFRPTCPHFAPSPVFHHYPNYPTFPEAYPVYCVPPPHNSKEQPRYEYDKDAHFNHHCCGCPNHPCNQRNDRNLKIVEQEPNAEKQEPIQSRSCSYPIVWIPPEYMKSNNDQSQVSEGDKAPSSANVHESSKPTKPEPKVWNGWFPVDTNSLKSLMQGEREKKPQNQQGEDKLRQFPFPFFWLPSEESEDQDKRKMKTALDHSKQTPFSLEFVPGEQSVSDVRMDKPQENKDTSPIKSSSETKEKTDKKCAPIKQIPVRTERKSEESEKKGKDVIVNGVEDTTKKELAGTSPKGNSSSSPKTSKLPPICLRVDPIPKKRNGNSSSISPSPPKPQPQQTLSTSSTAPGLKEDSAVKSHNGSLDEMKPGQEEIKIIQVNDEGTHNSKAEECSSAGEAVSGGLPMNSKEVSGRIGREELKSKIEEEKVASSEEVVKAEKATETMNQDVSAHSQSEERATRMSDVEAANIIQSAYRGFEVRKWEPLKKLKQLAKVRDKVDEVRNHIKALETSSDLNKDDRQRLFIGEMIMSLLLKLDTIQGLHSSVRDARKSLARELVTLQEKLDSLTSKQVERKVKELATAQSAEHASFDGCVNASVESEKENASAIGKSSFEVNPTYGKDEQTTGLSISDQELNDKVDNEVIEVNADMDHNTQSVPITELENEASNVQIQDAIRIQGKGVSPDLEYLTNLPSVPEQKSNADELSKVREDSEEKLMSLQNENIDPVDAVGDMEKLIGNGNGETEFDLLVNPTLPAEVENEKDQGMDLREELPVGVIEPVISDVENCEPQETVETNTVSPIEEQSVEETSDGCVPIQKENEFIKKPELEVEVEQTKEIKINDEKKSESKSDCNPEEAPSTVGEQNNDSILEDAHYATSPVDSLASSESEVGSVATQDKEVLFEEMKEEVNHPITTEEKLKLEKEHQEQEFTNNEEKATEKGMDKIGGDDNLIEENKKLREMIEKLMEAGKDQLTAISNLTGRVQELEGKLSKNKILRKPKYRKPISATKSNKVKGRTVEVAM